MLFYNDRSISIYFGSKTESFAQRYFSTFPDAKSILESKEIQPAAHAMSLSNLIVLDQIHSSIGYTVAADTAGQFKPYKHQGDFLVTKIESTGLAVITADCQQIIIHDSCNGAIGIAHAGWRGSLAHIATTMLETMQSNFGTQNSCVRVFFGPSAQACCYEVKEDFIEKLAPFTYGLQALEQRNNKLYFDLPLFNQLQLESIGIDKKAINVTYNKCTMCNPEYCSHRRDGHNSLRQMTIVALKKL